MTVRNKPSRHIVVVGAGILGACIAWRISERGFPVTLIDKSDPGSGASRHSFAMINADAKFRSPKPMKISTSCRKRKRIVCLVDASPTVQASGPVRLTGLRVGDGRPSRRVERLDVPGSVLVPVALEATGYATVGVLREQ